MAPIGTFASSERQMNYLRVIDQDRVCHTGSVISITRACFKFFPIFADVPFQNSLQILADSNLWDGFTDF